MFDLATRPQPQAANAAAVFGVPFDWRMLQGLPVADYPYTDLSQPNGQPVAGVDRLATFALELEDTLQTAIIISLFTDARAGVDDKLPPGVTDRRGWVGDEFMSSDFDATPDAWGSRLWLYYVGKTSAQVLEASRFAAYESLQWLVRGGIASRITVTTQWLGERVDRLAVRPTIYKPGQISPVYDVLWGTSIPSIATLRQNVERLLQQSLAQGQQSADPNATLGVADLDLARSNTRALAFVKAIGLHGAYRYLRDFIAPQAIPIKSTGEFLDGWLATYGLQRKEAAAASGLANGTGLPGTLVAAGTLLQTSDGRQYKLSADTTVTALGAVQASVIALMAGAAGNLAGGAALTLVSPVAGIDAQFAANTLAGISSGADPETDAQAVYRLQQRLANPPLGGSPADYARWALAVPGITRAFGVRNPAGATSAGVIIMADGNPAPGLPTLGQRDAVVAYIRDPERGPPDELFVIIPISVAINFTINLVPDTAALRAAVVAALTDLFFREAVPGGSIPQSHATEVISAVTGEFNHTISVPAITSGSQFTVSSYDRLLVLGTITFV